MAVLYMDRAAIERLDAEKIKKIVESNLTDMKYSYLYGYYKGEHKILKNHKKDSNAPNNKIVVNIAKYITDTATGYFVGKPVVYNSSNPEFLEQIQDVFNYNDEQDHNMEVAKNCSIGGSCFEMLYLDKDAQIRLARVPANTGIMIYESDSGVEAPLVFIRVINSKDTEGKDLKKIEFWNYTHVKRYVLRNNEMAFISEEEHFWNDIPFTEYINNEERQGDFEGVISGIDAYNKAQSNTGNYFQYNDDAILKVMKLGDVSSEDIADMKEKGAIILEDGGDVGWLLKQIDDTALENYKRRLKEDIHTMSNVPNLSDDSFGGNMSGVAISYKLWGLDQICAIKQRKFKKGLQRRIELITTILNIMGNHFDYREITPKFRVNKPQNILETAQVVTSLSGELSRQTRLEMLQDVENVQEELERLEREKEQDRESFGVYENFAKAFALESEDVA